MNKTYCRLIFAFASVLTACSNSEVDHSRDLVVAIIPNSVRSGFTASSFSNQTSTSTSYNFTADDPLAIALLFPCGADQEIVEFECEFNVQDFSVNIQPTLITKDPNDSCGESKVLFCSFQSLSNGSFHFTHGNKQTTILIPSVTPGSHILLK